ncbi:MAG TPA: hypothetical protein VKZ79_20840 [Alphaproteobacteria bacterium]|nr:hypothetical protein [Alphaproteobacteria bacterium]
MRVPLVVTGLLLAATAYARPPENADPALAPWFEGLHQPHTGISCCSIADCRPTDYREVPNGYEVLIDDRFGLSPPQWQSVPPEKILDHIGNPTGRAVVCFTPAAGIMCFVRPPEA